ncbi:MAG: hypothetical protein ACOC1J_02840 [Prolixibacteraceae bacterium]
MNVVRIIFFLTLIFTFHITCSQDIDVVVLVRIETIDGNEYTGEIVRQDSTRIFLATENLGEVAIRKSDIKSQENLRIEQIKDGEIWFANPQSTRYFWSPNGYGLKKGEGYYQNIWVMWNQFAYGLTDNFSVGGAVVPLFLFGGAPTPVFGTAKLSFPIEEEKINLGVGAIAGTVIGESETGFGMLYGLSTFGSRDNNVSFGIGYGFGGGEWASAPIINLNGMFRLASRWYFLTENYYINIDEENFAMVSLGGRWIIKKAALDFGFFIPVAEGAGFIGIPWLGMTIPFGKKN